MKKGYTRKICPGCQEDPGHWGRPADGVCGTCDMLLAEAKARRLLIELERQQQSGRVGYCIPSRTSWPVHKLKSYPSWDDHPDMKLSVVFLTIAGKLLELNPPGGYVDKTTQQIYEHYYKGSNNYDQLVYVLASPENAQLVGDLYRLIVECLQETYNTGKREGSSALLQLAAGEITVNQFNERTMKG